MRPACRLDTIVPPGSPCVAWRFHGSKNSKKEKRRRRPVQANEPRHPPERPNRHGAGVQRLRLLGREHLARARLVGRARGHEEPRAAGARPGRTDGRCGLVALARHQHSRGHNPAQKGRGQGRRLQAAGRLRAHRHRFRRPGQGRPLPAGGRQTAPLQLHAVRAEGGRARRERRKRLPRRIHDQRQRDRPSEAHRQVRAEKVGGRPNVRHRARIAMVAAEVQTMTRHFAAMLAALAVFAASAALAQEPVKIGLIMPYSGQFADAATQMDNAIKLYMKEHGDTVAGRKLEIIRRDTGGVAPDIAKRHAQELVVRDRVDILAGFVLTPNALAAADVSAEAKKFMVVMNAATAIITTKSPYMARTSLTVPQLNETFGAWAYRSGIRKLYTMVSDYGPGHDAEGAFQRGFKEAGGEIVGSVRIPVVNPDFFPFVQRAKDLNPEAMYVFIPGGAQPAAFGKALVDLGIDSKKTRVLGQGEISEENALKIMGDAALGLVTAFHYDHNHKSAANAKFVSAYNAAWGRNPDFFSVGGWDGMHLIYEALKKTGGKTDAESLIAAAKGMKWESPRGAIAIDPETRDIVQTVYIRRVEKVGGRLVNVEIDKIDNVKDPVKERMKK